MTSFRIYDSYPKISAYIENSKRIDFNDDLTLTTKNITVNQKTIINTQNIVPSIDRKVKNGQTITFGKQQKPIFVAGGNGTNRLGWSDDGKNWYPSLSGDNIFTTVIGICFKPLASDRQEYEVYIENEDNVIVLDNNEKLSFNCEVYNNDVKDISIVCLV